MSCPFSKDNLSQLEQFIKLCKIQPDIIHHPDLGFFRDYIEELGGEIPKATNKSKSDSINIEEIPVMEDDTKSDSEPESDLELDMEGCIEPDELDDNQYMGVVSDEPISEEQMDQADEKRMEAMKEFSNGDFNKAIELFTAAIKLNPTSALLFAKRGQAYLKLNKPNACIKDCTKALEFNPDSAAAFKFRGRARRLIADWENAAKDLRQACNIDFDEQTDEWLKEVTPNARKLEQHKLKQERKKAEKELKEKQERIRKAREANARAAAESAKDTTNATNENAGFPGAGAGGAGMDDLFKLLNDPEMMQNFQDPEVAAAFQDISKNPANILKYQSNPKIAAIMAKLASKLGGSSGGGFPNMAGMFPGAGVPPPTFPTGPTGDDVELD